MNISVIVICLNEEENIKECLNSLISQKYPSDKYEIIVVDGGSKDHTQQAIKEIARNNLNVLLEVELKKGAAAARNAGINTAKYNYVAFIDADCMAPFDWLETLSQNYNKIKQIDSNIIAVGGSNITPNNVSKFTKAIGISMDSYIGSFNSVQGRLFNDIISVPSLSNLNALYDRKKLIEIGCYDEALMSEAEDADINFRLINSDYKLYFIPNSFVWHKMRSTPQMWFKNMFRYGKGRARLLKRYPDMWAFCYLLPLLFFLAMFSLLFIYFSKLFLFSICYFPFILCYSLLRCIRKKSLTLVMHVTMVYLIQHFGYSFGEVYGLINPKIN